MIRKLIASASVAALMLSAIIIPGMGFGVAQAASDPVLDAFEAMVGMSVSQSGDVGRVKAATYFHLAFIGAGEDCAAANYSDDPGNLTASEEEAVNCMKEYGYMTGYADGSFGFGDGLQEQHLANVLFRILEDFGLAEEPDDAAGVLADLFEDADEIEASSVGPYAALAQRGILFGEAVAGSSKRLAKAGLPLPSKFVDDMVVKTLANAEGNLSTQEMIDLAADADALVTAAASNADVVASLDAVEALDALLAATPDTPTDTPVDTPADTPAVVPGGTLTVATASSSPAATIYADGTAYNPMLVVTLSAANSTNVTGFTLRHDGISTDANISGVLVLDSTEQRHGNVVTFSEKVAELTFSADPINVTGSTTVTFHMNFGTALNSGTVGLSLTAVESTADTVNGLPLVGAVMTTVDGASSIGSLDPDVVGLGNAARAVDIGVVDQEVTRFTLAAGSNEHVYLNKLTVYNNGNSSDSDVENIRLKSMTTSEVLSTVAKTTNKYATFDLTATPFKIEKGRTENLSLVVDVKGGSTRTIQFRILNDYDLELVGESGNGILAATGGAGTDTAFPIGDSNGDANATTFNSLSIGGGAITVSRDTSSPSGNISQGSKNQVLGKWKIEATGEDIEIRKACISLNTTATNNTANNIEADYFSGTIKLQRSNGATVYSFSPPYDSTDTDELTDAVCQQVTLSSYFTIKAGESETMSIVVDILSTLATGVTLAAEFIVDEYKRLDTNDISTTGSGDANAVAANTLTNLASTLTSIKDPAFASQTTVSGSPKTKIGSLILQAGAAENINFQTLAVALDNDATPDDSAAADTITGVSNLRLCKAGTKCATTADQYGSTVANPTGAVAGNSFTVSGALSLNASSSVTIEVVADLASNADAAITVYLPSTGISYVGSTSNTSNTTYPTADLRLQTNTIASAGTLKITQPIQPAQKVIHASETDVHVMSFKVEANSEAMNIDKVILTAVNGAGNLQNFKITDSTGTTVYGSGKSLVNANVTFSGMTTMIAAKDSVTTYKVYASTTGSGTFVSAQTVEVRLGGMDARGANSNTTVMEYSNTTETGSALSAGHYPVNAVVLFNPVAVGEAVGGLITTAANEDTVLTTGLTMVQLGVATAAVQAIAATQEITKLVAADYSTSATATVRTTVVPAAAAGTHTFAAGDLVFVWDQDAAANTGLGVVKTAATTPDVGDVLTFYAVEGATNTGQAVTLALNDVIVRLATAKTGTLGTGQDTSSEAVVLDGIVPAIVVGDVCFFEDHGTVANSDFFVATAAVAASGDISVGNTPIQGVTMVDNDSLFCYTPISSDLTDTSAANSYNVGDVIAVTDGTAAAASGLYVVETALPAGGDLTAADALGVGITFDANDYIAKLFTAPVVSNILVAHDVEPVITVSSTALTSPYIDQAEQEVAIFTVTASGPRDLVLKSVTWKCTGAGSTNTEVADNPSKLFVDGTLQVTTAENGTSCITGRTETFSDPGVTVQSGTSVELLLKFDTAATPTSDWTVGESLVISIAGSAGQTGGGLAWYYTAASPSPGTEPTYASPATYSDSYPVNAPALTQ